MALTKEETEEFVGRLIKIFSDAGFAVVPKEPTPGLLKSMALRYDHGIFAPHFDFGQGCPTVEERQRHIDVTLTTMKQLHEEVVGTGFYKPDKEDFYNALAETWNMTEAYAKLKKDAGELGKKMARDLQKD